MGRLIVINNCTKTFTSLFPGFLLLSLFVKYEYYRLVKEKEQNKEITAGLDIFKAEHPSPISIYFIHVFFSFLHLAEVYIILYSIISTIIYYIANPQSSDPSNLFYLVLGVLMIIFDLLIFIRRREDGFRDRLVCYIICSFVACLVGFYTTPTRDQEEYGT